MKRAMADKTKIIIITSNEDLIDRFSSNKSNNTHVIDLDDDEQMTSMTKDNRNMINLAFLAQLSETNSKNDLIYKRALDSPHHGPNKTVKMSKKSMDSICAICGDRAIGFNFDVLSCAPCKAFFRRNAHQNLEKLKCLTGQGRCSVEYETRRKCTRCRLDRCFAVGMRKDFIMNEEEKQLRRERLEQIRTLSSKSSSVSTLLPHSDVLSQTLGEIDQLMMNINENDHDLLLLHENTNLNRMEDTSLKTLSIEDWLAIEGVRTSFLSTFQNNDRNYSHVDPSDPASTLISWSHFFSDIALRFISFFRQIDEFENLHADDRFILIKYNLFSLYPICRCFNLKSINDYSSYDGNAIAEEHRRVLILWGASSFIHQSFVNMVLTLLRLTEQDSILLILLLTILIFTHRLSMNEDEPPLNNSLAVNRAQCHYTTLLWNYLINKRGEFQARKYFTQLLNIILRIQSETKLFQHFFRVQMMSAATIDSIAPLMQTVLHIS